MAAHLTIRTRLRSRGRSGFRRTLGAGPPGHSRRGRPKATPRPATQIMNPGAGERRLAGLIMRSGGDAVLWVEIGVLFFR